TMPRKLGRLVSLRAAFKLATGSTAFGKPTMPSMVGGPGGSLVSGRDFSLAQIDTARHRANDAATITKPSMRSRRRLESMPGGGAVAWGGAGLALGGASAAGGVGSKRALHTPDGRLAVNFLCSPLQVAGGRAIWSLPWFRAHNSAVECVLHTDEVAGSI